MVAEIRDAESVLNDDTVQSLEDEPLPEVDDALVQQISRFGSGQATGLNMAPYAPGAC